MIFEEYSLAGSTLSFIWRMCMNYQELINNLTQTILVNIKTALQNEYRCDKTYKARIARLSEDSTSKYFVNIKGEEYIVSSSISCKVGDFVWVCAPCGDKANMFVVCKTK